MALRADASPCNIEKKTAANVPWHELLYIKQISNRMTFLLRSGQPLCSWQTGPEDRLFTYTDKYEDYEPQKKYPM